MTWTCFIFIEPVFLDDYSVGIQNKHECGKMSGGTNQARIQGCDTGVTSCLKHVKRTWVNQQDVETQQGRITSPVLIQLLHQRRACWEGPDFWRNSEQYSNNVSRVFLKAMFQGHSSVKLSAQSDKQTLISEGLNRT